MRTTTGICLPLHQAKKIRDNNYNLTDNSNQPKDKYNGHIFTRFELDQHIWELEAKGVDMTPVKLTDTPLIDMFFPGELLELIT